MGRYTGESGAGATNGVPRRQVVTLTASNAAVPVPSWAQGGRGMVRVSGCGGGGSGAVGGSTTFGCGGQAGAWAVDHPMLIPAGVATLAAVIGAGAAQVSATAATNGNQGGDTTLTVGANVLKLGGGAGGLSNGSGAVSAQGWPSMNHGSINPSGTNTGNNVGYGLGSGAATLGVGCPPVPSGLTPFNAGGQSPFGGSPGAAAQTPGARTDGADATGYGAGGQGGCLNGGAVATKGGAGAPGLLILEFVEGL